MPKCHPPPADGLNLDDEGLKDVITHITRLTPKPGGNHGDINKAESYVVPDFFIFNNVFQAFIEFL